MQLTRLISVIRKYRMLPLVATGRYSSRAELIFSSVSAAVCSFWLTSCAVTCKVTDKGNISTLINILEALLMNILGDKNFVLRIKNVHKMEEEYNHESTGNPKYFGI